MARRLLHWLPILSIIALLVALVPAGALAQSPQAAPTVNGLFYGDGDYALYQWYGDSPPEPGSTRTRGTLYKYYDPATGWLYFAMVVDRSVNDNVFGNKSNGQPDRDYLDSGDWGNNGHTFNDLISSDNMEFYISCGGTSYDWYHGYLYDLDGDLDHMEADWRSGPEDPADGMGGVRGVDFPTSLVTASSLEWNMNYYAQNPGSGWDVTLGNTRAYANWKSPASGAAAGTISHIDIANGGNGYTTATVDITDPTGTGATAIAQIDNAKVTWVHVTNPGSGYTSPTVTINGDGTGATATAVLGPTTPSNDPRVTDEDGYPPRSEQPFDNINFDAAHNWEWPLVYEFGFDYDTECGGAPFDQLIVVSAHNSPSKDASEDVPLSVDLAWFDAKVLPGGGHTRSIELGWETTSESENAGFYLWRGIEADGSDRVQVNATIIASAAPPAGGGAVYEYVDEDLAKKTTYYYWLQDVDMYGVEGWSDPIAVTTTGKGRGNK